MCSGECQQAYELVSKHLEIAIAERNELRKQLAQLPKYVDEYNFQPSGTTLTVNPQSRNVEKITRIRGYCQFGTNGPTLTLGERAIPVNIGEIDEEFGPDGILLKPGDKRTLTSDSGTAGIMWLELLGQEMGDQGVF